MPICSRRPGQNKASVVQIPSICHTRMVFFSVNTSNLTGWTIRDFMTNRILDNEHSRRQRDDIEAEIDLARSELAPFYSIENHHAQEWERYLILRTIAVNGRHDVDYNMAPAIAATGDEWLPILPEPPWAPLQL